MVVLEQPLVADLNAISASLRILHRKLGSYDKPIWTVSLGSLGNGWGECHLGCTSRFREFLFPFIRYLVR